MKKSFSKTIAVLLAVLMVVCSLPMTVFAAGESRSNLVRILLPEQLHIKPMLMKTIQALVIQV